MTKETSVFWFYKNIIKSKNVPFLRRCHQNSLNKRSTESRKFHTNPNCNFHECILHSKIYKNLNPSIIQQTSFSSSSNNVSCSSDGDSDIIPIDRIRNFSIIAHVDHGKSTLADRFLELTGAIEKNSKKLVLDSLRVEQERGITVKAQAVTLFYRYNNKSLYMLNLIDTPGHVDFSSEVSRSLSVCDGVILLVDASQGIQAQTIANFELAKSKNLAVIPAINKIDMKNANPDAVCEDLKSFLGIEPSTVRRVSAKIGTNVEQLLIDVINCIPPPKVNRDKSFRALCFDSWYDRYRGALNLVYVNDGQIKIGNEIKSSITSKTYSVKSLSILRPNEEKVEKLVAGQVGLIGCNMRTSKESIIGDTYHLKTDEVEPLHRFEMPQPMVFAGVYPADMSKHVALRSAIEKLVLNDSAVTVTVDSSPALGQGWRLGFLGILHMEVFCQRLEQEYDAEPIIVAPSITYKLKLRNKKLISQHGTDTIYVSNALLFPDPSYVEEYAEPFVKGTIISPSEYLGPIMGLCVEKRGILEKSTNIDNDRIIMIYTLPLCEIILDFNDRLKSISSGYASFNYENCGYHPTSIVRLDIRLNGQVVEEFSRMSHTSKVQNVGRDMVLRLKELIPRQMIQISIQACVGGKVIARETIKPYRKDVTAKLYGGDVTRRMKLLRQQAEGKKKMKSVASIQVPHDTYVNLLKK